MQSLTPSKLPTVADMQSEVVARLITLWRAAITVGPVDLGDEKVSHKVLQRAYDFTWIQAQKFISFIIDEVDELRSSGKAFDLDAAVFRVVQMASIAFLELGPASLSPQTMVSGALLTLHRMHDDMSVWENKYSRDHLERAMKFVWQHREEADRLMSKKFVELIRFLSM
jgi:hypothetical protein